MAEGCFLFDSNICIYLLRGLDPVLDERVRAQAADTLFISTITLAEIMVGLHDGARSPQFQAFLQDVAVREFSSEAAEIYGKLPFRRARFDRLIAAHALSLDLTIVTNNESDFADIPGLRVENWTR